MELHILQKIAIILLTAIVYSIIAVWKMSKAKEYYKRNDSNWISEMIMAIFWIVSLVVSSRAIMDKLF